MRLEKMTGKMNYLPKFCHFLGEPLRMRIIALMTARRRFIGFKRRIVSTSVRATRSHRNTNLNAPGFDSGAFDDVSDTMV